MVNYVIDISGHQGQVDFEKVKASGITGVMLKCTEGTGYLSPVFQSNYEAAQKAGLKVGAYHYLRTGSHSGAAKEGRWFGQNTQGLTLELGLALDIEPEGSFWDTADDGEPLTPTDARNLVSVFAQNLEKYGHEGAWEKGCLLLYSTIDYFNRFLTDSDLQSLPRWLANPSKLPFHKAVKAVQYSWQGKVEGIATDVDLNVWYPRPQQVDMESLSAQPVKFPAASQPAPEPEPPTEHKGVYHIKGTFGCIPVDITVTREE